MKVITADSTIAEVVRECPSARRIFDQHGLHGCGGQQGPAESLAFFADVHQVDLAQLLRELNAEVKCPARDYRYEESLADFIYRRFFKAGIAIAITLGVLWGAINLLQIGLRSSFLQPGLLPAIHAHAHAMVYGWVCLFVMGFAFQSFPRFKNTNLWHPELANLTFYLMLTGIGARVAAELLQPASLVWPSVRWPRASNSLPSHCSCSSCTGQRGSPLSRETSTRSSSSVRCSGSSWETCSATCSSSQRPRLPASMPWLRGLP